MEMVRLAQKTFIIFNGSPKIIFHGIHIYVYIYVHIYIYIYVGACNELASQLEIRGREQSARTFILILSYSRKPERTMPDSRVTFHCGISKLKILNFAKVQM